MNKISAFPISLRQAWHGDNEIAFVNHNTVGKYKELLHKAYNDLYIKTFPLEKGGIEIERWMDVLENFGPDSPDDYRILIAGKNLDDPEKAEINGVSMGIYFRKTDIGLLAYIAVNQNARVNGLGHTMHQLQGQELWNAARDNKKGLRGWYIECYDPAKVPQGYAGYDSQKLVDKYVQWGAERLPIDYVVPDTHDSSKREDTLTLLAAAHPVTKLNPDRRTHLDYVRSLWELEGVGKDAQDKDPAMQRMASQLGLPIAVNDSKAQKAFYRPSRTAARALSL